MPRNRRRRPYLVLLWQVRAAFRILCWLAGSVGETMVVVARAFRVCARASATLGPVVIPAQLVLLVVWAPTRLLFLGLERAAHSAYWTDTQLRRRLLHADTGRTGVTESGTRRPLTSSPASGAWANDRRHPGE